MKSLVSAVTLASAIVGSAAAQSTSAWGIEGPIRFANIPEFSLAALDTKAGLPILIDVYSLTATRDGKLNGFADVYVLEQNFGEDEETVRLFNRTRVPIGGVYKAGAKATTRYFNRPAGDSSTRISTSSISSSFSFALRARGADYDVTIAGSANDVASFGDAGAIFIAGQASGNDSGTVRVAAKAGNFRAAGLDSIFEDVFGSTQDASLRTTTASFPAELGSARSFVADAAVWDEGVSGPDDEEDDTDWDDGVSSLVPIEHAEEDAPFTPTAFADGSGGITAITFKLYTAGQRAPGFLNIAQVSDANYGIRAGVRVFTTATTGYVDALLGQKLFSYVNLVGDDEDPELPEELQTKTSWNARGAFLLTSTTTWDSGTLDETTGF